MARTKNNEPPQLEIPTDKAATIARLDGLKAGDWEGLRGLSDAELAQLEAEAEAAYVYQPRGTVMHPHNQARLDGMSALLAERVRRGKERARRHGEQMGRAAKINEAAELIGQAARLIECVDKIGADPDSEFARVQDAPALDVATASDKELETTAHACRRRLDGLKPQAEADKAAAFAMLKGRAASAISSELSARADKMAQVRDETAAMLAAIEEEQGRRGEERRALEARTTREGIDARLAELERLTAGADAQGRG